MASHYDTATLTSWSLDILTSWPPHILTTWHPYLLTSLPPDTLTSWLLSLQTSWYHEVLTSCTTETLTTRHADILNTVFLMSQEETFIRCLITLSHLSASMEFLGARATLTRWSNLNHEIFLSFNLKGGKLVSFPASEGFWAMSRNPLDKYNISPVLLRPPWSFIRQDIPELYCLDVWRSQSYVVEKYQGGPLPQQK